MKIYSSQQAYAASASTAATGYPASNVAISQVGRPWRSTAITQQTLTLDLGSSITPASLLIQEANWTTATVESSTDNIAWAPRGTLTNYRDNSGRYKGLLELTGTYRYLRLTIGVQTVLDGAAYFSVGAAYVFKLSEVAPIAPETGLDDKTKKPQARIEFENGRKVNFRTGWDFAELQGRTPNKNTDDAARLLRLASTGVVCVDMELPQRDRVWPMQFYESEFSQVYEGYSVWPLSFTLTEIV